MYDCLEDVLFRGFMTATVKARGLTLVFKTINMSELRQINEIREGLPPHQNILPHLIYSLYRIDGVNVLHNREENFEDLLNICAHFYPSQQRYFLQMLNVLNERSIQELNKLVPYTYGQRSKILWNAYKDNLLCSSHITGIKGTEMLGLNEAQKTWVYLNRMEDQHSIFELNYDLAKFIVSPHTKEIKKINEQESQRKREEAAKKIRIHETGIDEGWDGGRENQLVDQSVEELMSQMQRTLAGEKDFHDLVVKEHEDRIRFKMEMDAARHRKFVEDAQLRYEQEMANMAEGLVPSLVRPLTPQEVEREIRERKVKKRENVMAQPDNAEALDPDRADKFNEKWGYKPNPSFEDDYIRDLSDPNY